LFYFNSSLFSDFLIFSLILIVLLATPTDTTLEIQNNTLDLDTINNLFANFGGKSVIFDENPLSKSLCTNTEFITNNTPRPIMI
jgi:hypothetical protein